MTDLVFRLATIDDLPQMVEKSERVHDEGHDFRMFEFDESICSINLNFMIYHGIVCLAELVEPVTEETVFLKRKEESNLIGIIVGNITQQWFSQDKMIFDQIQFVLPEYRKTRVALGLYKFFIEECKLRASEDPTIKAIMMGNTCGYEAERVEKIYPRLGFTRMGSNFMMEI